MNNIKGKEYREQYIIKALSLKGSVRIHDLSSELGVSRETIRRDLKNLEKKDLLQCTHGGAIIDSPANAYYEAVSAQDKHPLEKKAISAKASELIKDYEAIIVIGSTTTECLSPYLLHKNHLTVITNSFAIAQCASQNPTNTIIILGGEYDTTLQATTGAITVSSLENYRADKVFFSARGISCHFGITSHPEGDSQLIKSALSISKTSILLCDYSKFWCVGLYKICEVSELDIIVSDSHLSQKKINELSAENVQVVIADTSDNS